jgi:hypothetical protein
MLDVQAKNNVEALMLARQARIPQGEAKTLLALPHDRRDLWPDSKTGAVSQTTLRFAD